jgi:hypothetical protein
MEKIKPYLEMLKKYHFWLLTGICVVVMLYCWNSATQEIEKQFSANKMKVEGEFSKIQKLNGLEEFPNPKWEEGLVQKGQEVARKIQAAAERIAKRQQPALTWPKETFSDAFIAVASKQSPLEWPDPAITEFQLAMPEEVKRLRTIVAAADTLDQAGIQWNDEDYQYILSAFTMDDLPAKQAVMRMRTRFWVFESLARIVAATNEGADDKFNLPIHDLEVMAVGGTRVELQPEEWQVAGTADVGGAPDPPQLPGYDVWPVRLRVRMDLKYLNRLLTACANSELPLDLTGVRFDHPNRSVVVKQEEQPDMTAQFRGAAGFGGFRPMGMEQEKEKEVEEEPEPKPAVPPRGTLVEITGFVYIANKESLKQGLSQPDEAAAVMRPATPPPTFAHSTAAVARPQVSLAAGERSS